MTIFQSTLVLLCFLSQRLRSIFVLDAIWLLHNHRPLKNKINYKFQIQFECFIIKKRNSFLPFGKFESLTPPVVFSGASALHEIKRKC